MLDANEVTRRSKGCQTAAYFTAIQTVGEGLSIDHVKIQIAGLRLQDCRPPIALGSKKGMKSPSALRNRRSDAVTENLSPLSESQNLETHAPTIEGACLVVKLGASRELELTVALGPTP
ncbi:MAG: hypothetical protein KIS67_24140 [Verrucomicrobiae bacterium]|nr:hypothetical protein [Verrucomicrobiae bacterium]